MLPHAHLVQSKLVHSGEVLLIMLELWRPLPSHEAALVFWHHLTEAIVIKIVVKARAKAT